jgi:hypothetical protein
MWSNGEMAAVAETTAHRPWSVPNFEYRHSIDIDCRSPRVVYIDDKNELYFANVGRNPTTCQDTLCFPVKHTETGYLWGEQQSEGASNAALCSVYSVQFPPIYRTSAGDSAVPRRGALDKLTVTHTYSSVSYTRQVRACTHSACLRAKRK